MVSNCSSPLSPCAFLGPSRRRLGLKREDLREGARCGGDLRCVDAAKFCDGECDCAADCSDEEPGVCRGWKCAGGYFKCQSSGK